MINNVWGIAIKWGFLSAWGSLDMCCVIFWGVNLTAREGFPFLLLYTFINQNTHSELSCWVSCFSFLSVQLLLVMKRESLKLRASPPSWTPPTLCTSFMTQSEVAVITRASSSLNPFSTCPPRKSTLIIISKLKHPFHCSRSGKRTECKLHLVWNYSSVSFMPRIFSYGQVGGT